MGRLYSCIITHLGHELIECDLSLKPFTLPQAHQYDKAIIATPIADHIPYIKHCIMHGKPVLCEKPLEKRVGEVQKLAKYSKLYNAQAWMVNNWAFVGGHCREPMSEKEIIIRTYNTGADGAHDLIQPLYLVEDIENLTVKRDFPGHYYEISGCIYDYTDFERSYIDMVNAFLRDEYDKLWHIEHMVTAHERVDEYQRVRGQFCSKSFFILMNHTHEQLKAFLKLSREVIKEIEDGNVQLKGDPPKEAFRRY